MRDVFEYLRERGQTRMAESEFDRALVRFGHLRDARESLRSAGVPDDTACDVMLLAVDALPAGLRAVR